MSLYMLMDTISWLEVAPFTVKFLGYWPRVSQCSSRQKQLEGYHPGEISILKSKRCLPTAYDGNNQAGFTFAAKTYQYFRQVTAALCLIQGAAADIRSKKIIKNNT
ncbi:hypothetical protein E2C01_037423 [Portunus trituberculatus]|uniref:Uncharacterized protein n=1 Tax=Portunus trituberculatus TaxID=210409 RepID=A0A5B7F9B7_PORTR|nr:hypothetical protein [Portunus trituberculatus]